MTLTARAQIRANTIDSLTSRELRDLISKLETAVDAGYTDVDDDVLDKWTVEILTARVTEGVEQ
ncbi:MULTISPECIES: hypothetical protein [unclassified Microbacterium]|uniref:hypothetical protein n=1 Tax=unclassified Microbacterium TaxID=2609290 RepID=UPI0030163F72